MRLGDLDRIAQDVRENNAGNYDKRDWTSHLVVTLLENAPTIDAVPVVRCREYGSGYCYLCKHIKPFSLELHGQYWTAFNGPPERGKIMKIPAEFEDILRGVELTEREAVPALDNQLGRPHNAEHENRGGESTERPLQAPGRKRQPAERAGCGCGRCLGCRHYTLFVLQTWPD